MGVKSIYFDHRLGGDEKGWRAVPNGNSRSSTSGGIPSFTRRWNPTLTSKSTTLGWGTRLGEGQRFGSQIQLTWSPPAASGIRNSGSALTILTVSRLTVMT